MQNMNRTTHSCRHFNEGIDRFLPLTQFGANRYPGFGLGVIATRASRLSDAMINEGVAALAKMSPALKDPDDSLLPDLGENLREVSVAIATAVANQAHAEGVNGEGVEGGWTEERIRE
jgi:malate dehydrogenase (oxaloacetate-decarboxylating)